MYIKVGEKECKEYVSIIEKKVGSKPTPHKTYNGYTIYNYTPYIYLSVGYKTNKLFIWKNNRYINRRNLKRILEALDG